MIVAVTGSSGLIGTSLVRALEARGDSVKRVVRRRVRGPHEIAWDPVRGSIDVAALAGVDAVVNLAGENLARRWTRPAKRRIRTSRVDSTALLSRTIASLAPDQRPAALLSASAIGIYGTRGDEVLDESSSPGNDFLAAVCRDWEAATAPASGAGVRVVHLRTGLVLSRHGGALPRMLMPFRFGVGGRLGNGRQWMSWISLVDIIDALVVLLHADAVHGPVDLVAPNPVTNAELTATLARLLHRPAWFPVPAFLLRLGLGEMATGTVLASQRVVPGVLKAQGFQFSYPTLEPVLRAVLGG